MTEEEFFISNYPDSCYGDKPLSPHWDFFQDGVQFGERKSEQRITELEQELADAKKVQVVEHFEAYGQCRDSRRIADLEVQIEKMKCCSNCVYLAECDLSGYEECKNFDKLELREIKE